MFSDKLIYLHYYEDENIFTDSRGNIIYNIFDILTPNDIFLFKHDSSYNCFNMKGNREKLIEIISIPCEFLGWKEIRDADFGDDLETMDRYERAKAQGCYI